MARCRCQGGQCSCYAVPGANVEISGSGQIDNPWVISSLASVSGAIRFVDSPEVDFTTQGNGTVNDPLIVSAVLPWVTPGTGNVGDVLTRQVDGTWLAAPSAVVDEAVVITGIGLAGDGSVASPLRTYLCTYGDLKLLCAP